MDTTLGLSRARQFAGAALGALFALTLAGCSLEKQQAPALLGPSEFGLSIVASASPDQLPRDGASESVVVVTVRNDKSQPVAGQRLAVALATGTAPGVLLSEAEVTTGADGRASFSVVAPPQTAVGASQISVGITPVGTNFGNAVTRTVTIALTGTPNTGLPVPVFTMTPTAPEVAQSVTFDASATTDEGSRCDDLCTYAWDFGDGVTASGRVTTHAFAQGRSYTVTLTVTDRAGTSASTRQVLAVTAPAAPTVTLAVSPAAPVVDQQATFTATATAASGHSIVRYDWNFGDGTSASTTGRTAVKTFTTNLTRVVTVTAVDDLGQTASASLSVSPAFAAAVPVANFSISPTGAASRVGLDINFDGSDSTVGTGASIASYVWNWGDGNAIATSSSPRISHSFAAEGTYSVRLTVTDSLGRTATVVKTVTILP